MRKNYTLTLFRPFFGAAGICSLLLAASLTMVGCGPEKQNVTAPPPPGSGPPAGANTDEYMKQMQKMKGRPGGPTMPGGTGGTSAMPGGRP